MNFHPLVHSFCDRAKKLSLHRHTVRFRVRVNTTLLCEQCDSVYTSWASPTFTYMYWGPSSQPMPEEFQGEVGGVAWVLRMGLLFMGSCNETALFQLFIYLIICKA